MYSCQNLDMENLCFLDSPEFKTSRNNKIFVMSVCVYVCVWVLLVMRLGPRNRGRLAGQDFVLREEGCCTDLVTTVIAN